MNLEELKKYKSIDNIEIEYFDIDGIPSEEQECGISIMRHPIDGHYVQVSATHQSYILKLLQSELFELTRVEVAKKSALVLSIMGFLEKDGITIRNKKKVVSAETRDRMVKRLTEYREKQRLSKEQKTEEKNVKA